MKKLLLTTALFALFASNALAQQIYLNCQQTDPPSYYRNFKSKSDLEKFAVDAWEQGVYGYVRPPASSWVVDAGTSQIMTPEDESFALNIDGLSNTRIHGMSKQGFKFDLNRISGELVFTRFIGNTKVVIQGIALPSSSTWKFQCKASSRPEI